MSHPPLIISPAAATSVAFFKPECVKNCETAPAIVMCTSAACGPSQRVDGANWRQPE